MENTTILQEVNLPNGFIRLIKYESDSNVYGKGSHYCNHVVNREEFGLLQKCTVIYNRPLTQEGLEETIIHFNAYLQLAIGDMPLQEGN